MIRESGRATRIIEIIQDVSDQMAVFAPRGTGRWESHNQSWIGLRVMRQWDRRMWLW